MPLNWSQRLTKASQVADPQRHSLRICGSFAIFECESWEVTVWVWGFRPTKTIFFSFLFFFVFAWLQLPCLSHLPFCPYCVVLELSDDKRTVTRVRTACQSAAAFSAGGHCVRACMCAQIAGHGYCVFVLTLLLFIYGFMDLLECGWIITINEGVVMQWSFSIAWQHDATPLILWLCFPLQIGPPLM